MSSLAEFLKGTVSDSLAKVLQPSGVLPAALFVLLNVGFVYPAATAEDVAIATRLGALDSGWQAVVLGTLILGIGFLLLSASNVVLDFLSGRTWQPTVTGALLRWVRRCSYGRLKARLEPAGGSRSRGETREQLAWRMRTRRPDERADSTPTAFGDALLAAEEGTATRYGMRMTALWEPLRAALDRDNEAVVTADAEKAVLSLAANLTFVLALYALESVVALSLLQHWKDVLMSLLVLPVAYVAYRTSVTKAVSWADAIDTVAALHRDELRDRMGVREPTDFADSCREFADLSAFVDGSGDPAPDLFTTTGTSVASPDGIVAEIASAELQRPPAGVPARSHRAGVRCHLVASRVDGADADDTLSISDLRVPFLRGLPRELRYVDGAKVVTGDPDAVEVSLAELGPGRVVERDFTLKRWSVKLDGDLTTTVQEIDERTLLLVTQVVGDRPVECATLTLFHTLATSDRTVTVTASGDAPSEQAAPADKRRWRLARVDPGMPVQIRIHVDEDAT